MIEGYLQRKTMRDLYLIRDQTVSVLSSSFRSMMSFDFRTWLKKSAPALLASLDSANFGSDYQLGHEGLHDALAENYTMALNLCISDYEKASAAKEEEMMDYRDFMQQSIPTHGSTAEGIQDYKLRSEWDVEDFILSGAIMHILCSLEGLERGLIRVLFLYGTQPGIYSPSRTSIHPSLKDLHKSSPEWEEAENTKSLYSVSGRHAVMASYAINADPDTDWNDGLWSMRTDRNTMAREVSKMRHPFQSFLRLHYDAYCAVRHLAGEAMSAQGIVL